MNPSILIILVILGFSYGNHDSHHQKKNNFKKYGQNGKSYSTVSHSLGDEYSDVSSGNQGKSQGSGVTSSTTKPRATGDGANGSLDTSASGNYKSGSGPDLKRIKKEINSIIQSLNGILQALTGSQAKP